MEIFATITLALSGFLLFMVGTMRLSNPTKTYSKNSGIELAKDVDLLNEVRGVSALMMSSGIIILLGTIMPKLTPFSCVVAVLLFLGFAIGRLLSIVTDGKPNKKIIQGLFSELILGGANLFCLINILG